MSDNFEDRLLESVRRTGARARRATTLGRWNRAGLLVIAGGAALATTRALIWPRAELDPVLVGVPRASLLLALGSLVSAALIALVAWHRSRASSLWAAQKIDSHLGLDDVVSSGFAFVMDGTPGPAAALAAHRARAACELYEAADAIGMPCPKPRLSRVFLGLLIAGLGVVFGALDSRVIAAIVTPPTDDERRSLSELEVAARELDAAAEADTEPNERGPQHDTHHAETGRHSARRSLDPESRQLDRALAALARQSAAATERGDRTSALRALRDIASARRQQARRVRRRAEQLAALASALGVPAQRRTPAATGAMNQSTSGRPPSDLPTLASEQTRHLSRLLRERATAEPAAPSQRVRDAERRRTLERLQRGATQAARSGHGELAKALRQATWALSDQRDNDAAESLDRAAGELARLEAQVERERTTLGRQAALASRAGALERALQRARTGRGGQPRNAGAPGEGSGRGQAVAQGGGRQLSATLMNRLTALGLAEGPTAHSATAARSPSGRERDSLDTLSPGGDSSAPSQISGTSGQAIAALEGLGSDGEPTAAYRSVFPSYGVRVEEALRDERIPAARRATVRRYFESIRPEAATREERP